MDGIFGLFERIKSTSSHQPISALIVGLGNPGPKYRNTRHNVGFQAIDALAARLNTEVKRTKFHALTADVEIKGRRCLLMKPLTFMNESGQAVEAARSYYKLGVSDIILIYDDISLPPGRLRVRTKGSAGGHNGVKSVIEDTGEDTFLRIKIGVGNKPSPDYDLARWVLSAFSDSDRAKVDDAIDRSLGALSLLLSGDATEAMNRYNS